MARPINLNPVRLRGKEARKVLEKIENPNTSWEYKRRMVRCVEVYKKIRENSNLEK